VPHAPAQVRQLRLCHNIVKTLEVSGGPAFDKISAAQRTTFCYYIGLLAFEDEDYDKARESLLNALKICNASSRRNRQYARLPT